MIIYFISRRFTGVHEYENGILKGWQELDAIEKKSKDDK